MQVKDIENAMDSYERKISHLKKFIEQAGIELRCTENEYRRFKIDNPHPDNVGGTGKYGRWTFDDTLADVQRVQELNQKYY